MSLTPTPTRACRPFRGGTVTEPAGMGGFSQGGPEGPAAMGLSLAGAGEGRPESRAWHPAPRGGGVRLRGPRRWCLRSLVPSWAPRC